MKRALYILFTLVLSLLSGCHDKDLPSCPTCENFSDGFVIGFDPCTGVAEPNGGNVGFIINITSQKDTVVAYNFPPSVYDFPIEYFSPLACTFPDSASINFPIKIKYRLAKEEEKTPIICRANLIHVCFNEFVFNREIIILSITK